MKTVKNLFAFVISLIVIFTSCSVFSFAAEIKPYKESGTIISVAHGGNWGEYPIYSKKAIESAFEVGADCVSISVKRTADGKFVLCKDNDLGKLYAPYQGQLISSMTLSDLSQVHIPDSFANLSDYRLCELSDAVDSAVRFDRTLIIDDGWQWRNEIYSYLTELNAVSYAIIRTDASKGEINEFLELSGGLCRVIGSYHGNIIFNARNYVSKLSKSGCCAVQLGTKNPYGVVFHQTMLSAFGKNGYVTRAMIATYDPDLCGQRTDTESTWNDLIDRGYSMIETNNITDLTNYISRLSSLRNEIITISASLDNLNTNNCSAKSLKEITDAKADASNALMRLSSYETLARTKGNIYLALNNFSVSNENHVKKGVLKVTAGKVIAVVLVTAAIVAGQVYTYKMQKRKKETESA